MNFAAVGKVPAVPQQPGQQNYPPQGPAAAAPAQAAPSSPVPTKKEPLNRSASSEEVIYVTQEELEKLKAEGHDDEFVVYSEEQDDKPAAPKQSSSPVPTTTTTARPVPVKASPQPPVPTQQTIQQQPQQQQKTDYVSNIEYDNSVELITGSPIEFIDYSKPRDIVVKTSFSHNGSPANAQSGPTITHSKPKHQGNVQTSE